MSTFFLMAVVLVRSNICPFLKTTLSSSVREIEPQVLSNTRRKTTGQCNSQELFSNGKASTKKNFV